MICPYCKSCDTVCKDSRPTKEGGRRRRYECINCDSRFSTLEIYSSELDNYKKLIPRTKSLVTAMEKLLRTYRTLEE